MIRLFHLSGSPFARRVQLALEEKKLPYESVWLTVSDGELRSPEHLARSPHGKVPALEEDGITLYESSAILEYVEERHPQPPLLPADPALRALARIEELECVLYFFEAFGPLGRQVFFTDPAERDEALIETQRRAVVAELEKLEARAAGRGGEYVIGEGPTRADLTWLPFVEIAGRAGVDVDPARSPWIARWMERLRQRPSYEACYPPHWRK